MSKNSSNNSSINSSNKAKKIDFSEKVIKYIRYDDLIKETMLEHQKAIKELKLQKKEIELFLINYLDEIGNDTIHYGNTDIIKKIEKKNNIIELKRVNAKKEHVI